MFQGAVAALAVAAMSGLAPAPAAANVFEGEEWRTAPDGSIREQHFENCADQDRAVDAARSAACASLARVSCRMPGERASVDLGGFHVVRWADGGYRLYTAAHVLNQYNRLLLGPAAGAHVERAAYGWSACSLTLLSAGDDAGPLQGVRLGEPHFRSDEMRLAVSSRAVADIFDWPELQDGDIVWMPIEIESDAETASALLAAAALEPVVGAEHEAGRLRRSLVCSAGLFALGRHASRSPSVAGCARSGVRRGALAGVLLTRAPTVYGMSGGPVVTMWRGQPRSLCVISSEVVSAGEPVLASDARSKRLRYRPGLENRCIPY
ncbi:MAG: hypothetical protein R3C52_01125 [Hyphomonadaceae bacterium]